MVALYVFILLVGAVGAGAYLLLFMSHIPGAADERLGKWEPLPENMDKWVADAELTSEGLIRESRHLNPSQSEGATKLVLQVRYRDPQTRDIVRVEPEITVRRKRVRGS